MDTHPSPTEDRGSLGFVVGVSFVAALGGLLFGYDTAVINGAIGFLEDHFELDSTMKGWAASSALLGCVLGVSIAGLLSDRHGRKKTLLLSAVLFLASAIGTAIPKDLATFVIFRVLGGVGVGIASMTSPMYIAEIAPARIRGRMVSVNQFAIVTGMLLVYFVNYFIALQGNDAWNAQTGWRWMFGSEAVPAVLFLFLLVPAPESPRWLAETGRRDRALEVLGRVVGRRRAPAELEMIERTIACDTVSFGELFGSRLRRVVLIAVLLAILQQVTGINVFLYYGTEIFKQLGSGVDAGLLKQVVVGAVNLIFTVVAIWSVDRLGRRPLMIVGSAGMGICLLAMGLVAQFEAVALWVLVFILGYIACFALSVGPVTWVILSEIFPTTVRGRALSVATFFLWTANFAVSQTFPMMDENAWLVERFHHAFPFYIYAGFCVVLLWVMVKMVPETKGKSLEEIEMSWRH